SRLALQIRIVGHDIGRLASGSAVLASEHTNVARAFALRLDDLAKPPGATRFDQSNSGNHRRGDAFFRWESGVSRLALDLDGPVLLADRAGDQVTRERAVEVEAHRCALQIRLVHIAGTLKAAFLAHHEQQ